MRRREFLGLVGGALAAAGAPAVHAQQAAGWKWVTGSVGGSWYTQAALIARRLEEAVPGFGISVVPGSSLGNITVVNRKEADLGVSMPIWGRFAREGVAPFKEKHPDVRAVAKLDPTFLMVLVTPQSGIKSVEEIKTKKYPLRLALRPRGDTSRFLAELVFQEYGFTLDDVKQWGGTLQIASHPEAVNLLRDGHVDGWIYLATFGHPPTVELLTGRDMPFLSISPVVLARLGEKYGFPRFVAPAGTFKGMASDVATVSADTLIISHTGVPAERVYMFTKTLVESKPQLVAAHSSFAHFDPEQAGRDVGFPLHAGAERYYRERGLLK